MKTALRRSAQPLQAPRNPFAASLQCVDVHPARKRLRREHHLMAARPQSLIDESCHDLPGNIIDAKLGMRRLLQLEANGRNALGGIWSRGLENCQYTSHSGVCKVAHTRGPASLVVVDGKDRILARGNDIALGVERNTVPTVDEDAGNKDVQPI